MLRNYHTSPVRAIFRNRKSGQFRYGINFLKVLIIYFLFSQVPSLAAPESVKWEYWAAHDENSSIEIKHDDWDLFLAKYLYPREDGINRVVYNNVLFTDREMLDKYITSLATTSVTGLNRNEQLAYWINLYNALTVQLILDAYPVNSIRDIDISPGFFNDGPWGKKLLTIEGKPVSLDDIEHRILRPLWKDPRIHYAVNCAALGCPNLGQHAYTANNVEKYLDYSARKFINSARAVKLLDGQLILSSIYQWFIADFGGSDEGVLSHLATFAEPSLAKILASKPTIKEFVYDWTLNNTTASIADRIRKRGS